MARKVQKSNESTAMEEDVIEALAEVKSTAHVYSPRERDERKKIRSGAIFSAFEIGKITDVSIDPIPHDMSLQKFDEILIRGISDYFPVRQNGALIGYAKAEKFRALLGQNPYTRNLFLRKENKIDSICETDPVILDARTTLPEAARILMGRGLDQLYDAFIVTYHGEYFGISTVKAVMDGITFYEKKDMIAMRDAQTAMNTPADFDRNLLVDHAYFLEQLGQVGGDFIYVQGLQPHLALFSLMDACGKGPKAAQMAMAIGAYFRLTFKDVYRSNPTTNFKNSKMTTMVNLINRATARSTPSDMYASGVVLFLDIKHNVLLYYDFGHPPVYLLRRGKVLELPNRQAESTDVFPFFGLDENLSIKPSAIRVQSGDIILAYSDGISELKNSEKDEYGEVRFTEFLAQQKSSDCKALIAALQSDAAEFRGNYRKLDDMAILAFAVP